MKSKLIVKFWLNRNKMNAKSEYPVYLRVRFKNEFFIKSTGIFLKSSNWDKGAMKYRGNSNEAYLANNQLDNIRMKVSNVFNQPSILGKPYNVQNIKNSLEGNAAYQISLMRAYDEHLSEMEKLKGKDYEPSTILKYRNTQLRLSEFLKRRYNRTDIQLYELNYIFIRDFEVFL